MRRKVQPRSTVLKVTQVKPSHGFVAWQALVDGYAPKSSNDPAIALQPTLANAQEAQGCEGVDRKAHCVAIESGRVRASVQDD